MTISFASNKMPSALRRVLGAVLVAMVLAVAVSAAGRGEPACGGGYPDTLCKKPLDSVIDNWGMYNRECVSYTAFRVASSGRKMPYGFGDANNWPAAARARGIAVDSTPRAGDVAIRTGGPHGHSMYVEAVYADGALSVSQYNFDKTGAFSRDMVRPDGLVFIHF